MIKDTIKSKIESYLPTKELLNKALIESSIYVQGLTGSLQAIVLSLIAERINGSLFIITPDRKSAEYLLDDIELFYEGNIYFLPSYRWFLKQNEKPGRYDRELRIEFLYNLALNNKAIYITHSKSTVYPIVSRETFLTSVFNPKIGEKVDLESTIKILIQDGFERGYVVERVGELAVRGGILDIFPPGFKDPVRIELFGNIVDSIRLFDINTQRSIKSMNKVQFCPPVDDVDVEGNGSCVLDMLQKDSVVFIDDPEQCRAKVDEFYGFINEFVDDNTVKSLFDDVVPVAWESVLASCLPYSLIRSSIYGDPDSNQVIYNSKPSIAYNRNLKILKEDISNFSRNSKKGHTFILCDNKGQSERLDELLSEEESIFGSFKVDVLPVKKGFSLPESGLSVVTDHEIFSRKSYKRIRKAHKRRSDILKNGRLNYGDIIVHDDHGLGKYAGLERIKVGGYEQECAKILYHEDDTLYVNIDKLYKLQKYSGDDGSSVKLNKLGKGEWEKLKKKTKKSVKNILSELVDIYASRKDAKGNAFPPDGQWQREMEASFIYEETPDQLQSTFEVKQDMEHDFPMDRLICGDVGYGKTEVAIRAAFKAVNGGKQVAILVPTTILAEQHYKTLTERLAGFPINIDVLSRFRKRKTQKEILCKVQEKQVDIVIGTHRLLSKDVKFNELGLIIVDEEHRFGVTHKERLKFLKKTVDVLTLTATPIPRTLNMSLLGLRDLSNILTPPKNRLPVITHIAEYSPSIMKESILKEIDRGGQVYFVHNRVQSIDTMASVLKGMLPGVKFAVAHGQMRESLLEKVMMDFMDKKYDCLISTMIIESGLDIPSVNTIIINRADRFGLAQLYQLRGRVGRSDVQAYAYLLTPPPSSVNRIAYERLRTIAEYTELGSGFHIAMRDLEIRGAGNLLGPQQSGFINTIGFELYCKILEEAVTELKAEKDGVDLETIKSGSLADIKIDIDCDMFFPESYIIQKSERVNLYRRIGEIESFEKLKQIEEEVRDRFGIYPSEAKALFDSVAYKIISLKLNFKIFRLKDKVFTAKFNTMDKEQFESIVSKFVSKLEYPFGFFQEKDAGLKVSLDSVDASKRTSALRNALIHVLED